MSDTTLTLDPAVKERLEQYRHPDHESWNDVLESMMAVLPTYEALTDGCMCCDECPCDEVPIDERNGAVHWSQIAESHGGGVVVSYCCSRECMAELDDDLATKFPREPDEARVGGRERPVVTIQSGLTYIFEGTQQELSIELPGVFSDSGDNEGYLGEPVHIKNNGEWVQSGVIEDVLHEDAYTSLLLGTNENVEMLTHPNERKKEAWLDERGEIDE